MAEKTRMQIIRERQGISVTEMRRRTNIPRVSYYRYEQDQRTPDARTAIRIAKTLGTTVEELWGTEPQITVNALKRTQTHFTAN